MQTRLQKPFLFAIFALAAPLVGQLPASNILVCGTFDNTVREYTPTGTLVQTFAVPHPSGAHPATEYARDLAVHPSGDLYVFNGTFAPYLSVRRAGSGQWEHYADSRWSTVNNISYGGIALYGNHAFVCDSFQFGGLFRFDLTTFVAEQFGQNLAGFFDVAVGWDGLVYGLATDEHTVHVFRPDTLAFVRTIDFGFGSAARGIGIRHDGHLYVSTWGGSIEHRDTTGALLQTLPSGSFNLHDLDLDPCGTILVGHRFGSIYQTSTGLGAVTAFTTGGDPTHVAFATPRVPAPAIASSRAGVPANPVVFTGPGALLGTIWSGTLAPFLPGALFDVVAFGAGPANVPTPHGTLLFDELLTYFTYDAAAGTAISVAIPDACMLIGLSFVAQAASVSLDTYALANALDVRIGWY